MYSPKAFNLIPPVVKNLLILNVLVFLATWLLPQLANYLALYYPGSPFFQPYQVITSMFTHAGFWHIFLNMFALWMFGADVERMWGPKRFLVYYLVCGFGAVVLHFIITYFRLEALKSQLFAEGLPFEAVKYRIAQEASVPLVGASGAVFGILLAYGVMFPNRQLMLLFPPIPMKAKYFVIMYGLFELFSGLRDVPGDNIAHFAHLGGMLAGIIMIMIWGRRQHY